MKCDTCYIQRAVDESKELVCCKWFMDNVICGKKTVAECTEYKPVDIKED